MIHLRLSQICRYCISDGLPKRSFFLALIVGTVLNLINQGEILFGGGKLNLIKIFLTYAVRIASPPTELFPIGLVERR